MRWGRGAAVCVLLAVTMVLAGPVAQAQTATRAFSVFARVPEPGQPEGLAVAPDGTVYAGTDVAPFGVRPDRIQPAKIFAFTSSGQLKGDYTIVRYTYSPGDGPF